MGQLFSSEEELSQVKDAIGSLLYDAMLEGGAVPSLRVVHPLHLANHDESFDSRTGLQEQLQQVNKILKKVWQYILVIVLQMSKTLRRHGPTLGDPSSLK